MKINAIQNNNYNQQFKGLLQVQNLKKGGKAIEQITSLELDKGLAESALKNIFEGNWANTGNKQLHYKQIWPYNEAILQTLGINLSRRLDEYTDVECKLLNNGYSIQSNDYKITHIAIL